MVTQNEKKHYKANLAGKNYTISGNASLPHFKATETLFNKQLIQIKTVAPNLSQGDQTVLLTFNALSDQLHKQAEIDELQAKIARLESELKNMQKLKKRREPKNAIGSIIDDAKHDSQARITDKLFNQGTTNL
ncbi:MULTISPECIES: cell division protein ZapA [Leuconostoc]|jgi:cell division protein ZapA|uniref:Stimulator of FtsZ polymerization and component of cell-division Z-ring n=2 Tax=Leuconostoc TaxID=1243 RepID=A0AAN2UFK0_9LACO|nr:MULTISPECIES: cell division protein ZapA [Leuconostoc]MBR2277005.1 cell division protein ZapA [Leuconostoc sp.]MBZ5944358.1 cell division protein ZapA [Leuconostoc gasicomitatum]MBZ5945194.1 cell division protein ZapA [Leuconostoc gasicomitatum]MBZ5947045.1 cell division protein ZapA [Leuconostoc gasicomitatum]MBZ5950433.1 cell division protein ZapA [Leuconostoc gasicomitatum]